MALLVRMLTSLFPGLREFEGRGIPVWKDESMPWSIITEKGVAEPPFEESIKKLFEANK